MDGTFRKLITEDFCYGEIRRNSRSEPVRHRLNDDETNQASDMVRGDNESPLLIPEFLTGRMPSRTHLNQSHDDLNALPDTTFPAQERSTLTAEIDPINGLTDVLTSMQNRPTTLQLTNRPVNCNIMIFDGKREKFELF